MCSLGMPQSFASGRECLQVSLWAVMFVITHKHVTGMHNTNGNFSESFITSFSPMKSYIGLNCIGIQACLHASHCLFLFFFGNVDSSEVLCAWPCCLFTILGSSFC